MLLSPEKISLSVWRATCDQRQLFFPVGYEVAGRIAASQEKYAFARGFHPTGTCNVFGCAAASAKLKGLSKERIALTLGIAGHFACGLNFS